jgi:tyrosyl-tRNA synthetase
MNIIEDLQWRGMLKDSSNLSLLTTLLEKPTTIYCGFDPSAKSMHIGNFVPISVLMRLQRAGHKVIAVVGGATGMIGDPSGKSKERNLLDEEALTTNTEAIKNQLEKFINISDPKQGMVVNNLDWLGNLSMIDYLRDYGKYFPINFMLAKDVVANRLETGISYTEFSYMLLQSIDFLKLYQREQCQVQFGGSDQWGNLTSGLELIRKVEGSEAQAAIFTTPLITRSDGKKFGKSEDGALFLDPLMTSAYELYQYFYNVSDLDAITYLKVFTFLSKEEIETIEVEHLAQLGKRIGQTRLAEAMVTLIHDEAALEEAKMLSEVLFKGTFTSLNEKQLLSILGSLEVSLPNPMPLEDLLVFIKAASSKREAKEFITNRSISINGDIVDQVGKIIDKNSALFNKYTVIRRGKKLYFLVSHRYV